MADAARSLPAVPGTPWMKALPPAMRFILHADAPARAAAAPVWGVECPEEACRAKLQGSRAALWMGPDEYLLIGTDEEARETAFSSLDSALGQMPHALVDVSHRQFALELSGPHAADILSGACPLDLDLGEFPTGMCTRTVLAKADIVLWRTGEAVFHLEVWRSFSGYVSGLIREIAGEFYGA
ncbi:MAG: sarcosine oxidase subunit gamma family protein [Steroidobacteraceae bacterium]